jgi:hypothetical protein
MVLKSSTKRNLPILLIVCVIGHATGVLLLSRPVVESAPVFSLTAREVTNHGEAHRLEVDFLRRFVLIEKPSIFTYPFCTDWILGESMETETAITGAHLERGPPLA